MLAVFASSVACATMRPETIVNVAAGETLEVSAEDITKKQSQYSSKNTYELIGVFTKDGQGTLTVSESYNVPQSLNVREGEMIIGNGTDGERVEIKAQPYLSDSPTISIGGNNASLVLDNASYKYNVFDSTGKKSYVSAVAIGNTDGAGSLTLKGGSELYTSQSFFAYTVTCQGHVQDSYAGTTGDALYSNGVKGQSKLNILEGSKVQAGMTFYFADIDILVDGEGSSFEDGARNISNYGGWLGDVDGSGSTDVVTNVTISNGGTWTSRNDLTTSATTTATTNITVTGKGSTFNSLRNTNLGDANQNATTNLTVENGAVANLTDVQVGCASGSETVNIRITDATMNIGSMTVNQGGTVTNDGTITVADLAKTTSWRDDSTMGLSGGYAANTEAVAAEFVVGGKVVNNGIIAAGSAAETPVISLIEGGSFTAGEGSKMIGLDATGGEFIAAGDFTFTGNVSMSNVDFIFANGVEIDLSGCDFTFTGGSITITLPDAVAMAYAAEADASQFGLVFKNAGTVSGLVGQEVTVQDAAGNTTTYTLTQDDVVVQAVPEPATATLSLLALAALAARRRRA